MISSILRIAAGIIRLITLFPKWIASLRIRLLKNKVTKLKTKTKTLEVKLKVNESKQKLEDEIQKKTQNASLDDIDSHFSST